MKAAPFAYTRPDSLPEALAALAEAGDGGKALAGGQSLVPLLAMRLAQPTILVDLDRVEALRGVRWEGPALHLGAMTTQREIERDPSLPALVREAVRHVGHFQIRTRGTVGGSIAHADPAAEWPALAVACEARLSVESIARGHREVAAADFFIGPLMTALEPDELLVEVVIPDARAPGALAEVARRPGDFALVGAVVHGGRAVVFGTGSRPQRLSGVEALLAQGAPGEELRAAAEREIEAADDVHASARYRRRVGAGLVEDVATRSRA